MQAFTEGSSEGRIVAAFMARERWRQEPLLERTTTANSTINPPLMVGANHPLTVGANSGANHPLMVGANSGANQLTMADAVVVNRVAWLGAPPSWRRAIFDQLGGAQYSIAGLRLERLARPPNRNGSHADRSARFSVNHAVNVTHGGLFSGSSQTRIGRVPQGPSAHPR